MVVELHKAEPSSNGQPETRKRTRALLILNKKARAGNSNIGSALNFLRERGIDLVESAVDNPADLSRRILDHRDSVDLVVIAGGDGTLSHAADGLVEAGIPLGILPLGTANDLARTLDIPTDPHAAAEVIANGHRRTIDLGWVNGTHFFNVASIGLTHAVTREISKERKSRWGSLAYFFAATNVVFRVRSFSVQIDTDAESVRARSVQISIGNGRYYGGGLTVDENAQIDDGLLNLHSLEVSRWWQFIPLLPAIWRGTLKSSKNARTMQGTSFVVRPLSKRPKRIMADGEEYGKTPAHFRIVPAALSVCVPEV